MWITAKISVFICLLIVDSSFNLSVLHGKPHIITPEYVQYAVLLPYKDLSKALDEGEQLAKKLEMFDEKLISRELTQNYVRRLQIAKTKMIRFDLYEPDQTADNFHRIKRATSGFGFVPVRTPISAFFGNIGEALFGVTSLERNEQENDFILNKVDELAARDLELASEIGNVNELVRTGLLELSATVDKFANKTGDLFAYTALSTQLVNLMDNIDNAVSTLLEVMDRGDQHLLSRNSLSADSIRKLITNSTKSFPSLTPVYHEANHYYNLPYAFLMKSANVRDAQFVTVFLMPMLRVRATYRVQEYHAAYVRLESKLHSVYLNHQEFIECHDALDNVVCIRRICKVSSFITNNPVQSGIVTASDVAADEDIVEVVLRPDNFTNSSQPEQIKMSCKGSPRLGSSDYGFAKSIVQFNLPKSCSANNQYFELEEVVTSLSYPRQQYSNINIGF